MVGRFILAAVTATVVASFTDWFFGGLLFHGKYKAYPEVWRSTEGGQEAKAIGWSIVLSLFAGAAFLALLQTFGIAGWGPSLKVALLVWCAGCLPVFVTNALFIKLHPLVVVSNTLGWLVKLGLFASASVLILR